MLEIVENFYQAISGFDLVYLVFTFLSLIKCSKKGFVLSVLSALKWLLAYVITLVLFPKIKPYVKDLIDNEYILDIFLGIGIFVIVIFIILLINKGFGKAIYSTNIIQFELGGTNIDSRTYFKDFWYFFKEHNYSLFRISPLGAEKILTYDESDEYFSIMNFIALKND